MSKFAYIMSALVVAGSPAVAQQAGAGATHAIEIQSSDSSDARRIVCKKEETIGSRLAAKKVCLTVQEWEERAKADRDSTEAVQRLSTVRQGN